MKIQIITPTLMKDHYDSFLMAHTKYTTDLTIVPITEGNTWAEAANIGIDLYKDYDIILMDDDIIVTRRWLNNILEYKIHADILGWTLVRPNNTVQFSGCYFYEQNGMVLMGNHTDLIKEPRETPNTTTSCCYIKRKVFDKIGGMDNETYKEGCHYEDSDFCYRARKAGFKIHVIPNIVYHYETLTKKDFPGFKERVARNSQIFYKKLNEDKDYLKQLKKEGFLI